MKLGLGTVQFGMAYGVANRAGRTPKAEAKRIMERAGDAGISLIDTAPAYVDAETVLGDVMPPRHEFRIVTKTPAEGVAENTPQLAEAFSRSLRNLRQSRIYGLVIHDPAQATGRHSGRLIEEMQELKAEGKVERIGISIYEPADADRFGHFDAIDMVQLPLNILDQRFLKSGHLSALKAKDIEIHARSAFLQGLLLMPLPDIPDRFSSARPILERFRDDLLGDDISPVEGSIGFLNGVGEIDRIIVGAATAAQFEEIIRVADMVPSLDYDSYSCDLVDVIDPRRWPSFH